MSFTGRSDYHITVVNKVTEKMNAYNSEGNSSYDTILGGRNCSISSPYQSTNITGVDNTSLQDKVEHNKAITKLFDSSSMGMSNLKDLAEHRKAIIANWEQSGLLEGLDMTKKSNIAQLLECQASFKLNENEVRPMKSIRLRFNHKFKDNNELWKLYIDQEIYIVSQVIFLCPTETTLDWDEEANDYKAHISCDANNIEVDHTSEPGRIIVTVKNL